MYKFEMVQKLDLQSSFMINGKKFNRIKTKECKIAKNLSFLYNTSSTCITDTI